MKNIITVFLLTLSLVAHAETGGWVNETRKPVPNSDAMKSMEGFGGWLVVTPDSDWENKWNNSPETIPKISSAKDVSYGDNLTILIFYINPKTNASGEIDIRCDLKGTRPDGSISVNAKGIQCAAGKLQGAQQNIRLSSVVIDYIGEDGDPPGEWIIEATLTDQIRKTSIPLKTHFVLRTKLDNWMMHYYEHPTPDRFVPEVISMSKAGYLAKAETSAPISAFLGQIMAANPSQIEGWLNQLNGFKGKDRDTLLLAASLSNTKEALAYIRQQSDGSKYQKAINIRLAEPDDASVLDMLWGDFFASGETAPIRRIVYALNYDKYSGARTRFEGSKNPQDREEAILESTFEAARWSLESNIQQHHRVAEIVEEIYFGGQTTHSEQMWLATILAKGLPEKYEFLQIKPGEWAFKRK